MEMEAEHYPNGVLESVATRIVNGAYKHEDLQTDESSMGENHGLVWCCRGGSGSAWMTSAPWERVGMGMLRQPEKL